MNRRRAYRLTEARSHRIRVRRAVMENYPKRLEELRWAAHKRQVELFDGESDSGRWLQSQESALMEATWKRMKELRP